MNYLHDLNTYQSRCTSVSILDPHPEARMHRQKPESWRTRIRRGPRAALALIVLSMCITGCQGMATTTQTQESHSNPRADNTVADWPFKFVQHNFGIDCYSTYNCTVVYSGLRQGLGTENELLPALDEVHPDALGNAMTGQVGIMNFPPPAQVRWRSKDGVQHDVEVDIGEIFKDQLILHEVPREDIREGVSILNPDILLVVQNRTIEVYMRAFIPTKFLQDAANPYSGHRDELVLAWTQTF